MDSATLLSTGASPNALGLGTPYDIQGEELDKLVDRCRYDLVRAKGRKSKLNARARLWRKMIDLDPKTQTPWRDGPDMTMPLIRMKYDGVIAHLTDSLDVQPFFSARPKTEEAVEVSVVWEALMERELDLSDGREQYMMSLQESGAVGTGVIGWSIALNARGEVVIQEGVTKFENIYAYPVAVDDFTNCSVFRRYKEPWFILNSMADAGLLDAEAVRDLQGGGGGADVLTHEEERDATRDSEFSDEQETHELWEAYVRWDGKLWRVIYSERLNRALSAKVNPFREAFNAPPFEPIRIMRKPNYVWGHSIPQLLEAVQKMADYAQNSRMAYNQLAITPVLMGDRMNPFIQKLDTDGVSPGMVIRTMGPPQMNGVQVMQFPKPDATLEDMELSQRLADMATFTDFQIQGAPFAAGRRTATEVRTGFNVGTLKLRKMLRDVRLDLRRAAKKRWALIELFKVRPRGVMPIYRDGKQYLISSDGIDRDDLNRLFAEFMQSGQVTPEQLMQEYQVMNPEPEVTMGQVYDLVNGGVPGMKRDDLEWVANGSDIIPDKAAELQKMDGFAQYMGWLEFASMDERVWYFLKIRLELMGRHDWRKLIGDNPKIRASQEEYMQMMQALMEQSSLLANTGRV